MKLSRRALLCVIALLAAVPPQAQAAAAVPRGRIVFSRTKFRNGPLRPGIYTVRPDGSGLARLTRKDDSIPKWSPGHEYIAFSRREPVEYPTGEGSESHLYVMDDSGRNKVLIATNNPSHQVWAPVGQMLAYYEFGDLWITNPDGTEKTQVTDHPLPDYDPSWSPDGTHLSFRRNDGIYVVDVATGEERLVFNELEGYLYETAWSPDGEHIAFTSTKGHFEGEDGPYSNDLWVVGGDGSDPRQLTNDCHWDQQVVWLDPERIVYNAVDDDDGCLNPKESEIQMVDLTGEVSNLTANRAGEYLPALSPDGRWITYERWHSGDDGVEPQVWIMRSDGTRAQLVADKKRVWDGSPDW